MRNAFLIFIVVMGFVSSSSAGFKKELIYAKVKSYERDSVVIQTPDNKKWQLARRGLNKNVKLVSGNTYIFNIAPSSKTPKR